jgi:hypothetical protein
MAGLRNPIRQLPVWARWALPIVLAVALFAGLVIAEHRAGPPAASSEAQAEAETNRIADIAISEDEAPRTGTLSAGTSPTPGLAKAIEGDVRERIDQGQLTGPLQRVACTVTGASSDGRVPYHCIVRSDGTDYTFLAIVEGAHRLTWCKVDPSANPGGPEVLISPRCRT